MFDDLRRFRQFKQAMIDGQTESNRLDELERQDEQRRAWWEANPLPEGVFADEWEEMRNAKMAPKPAIVAWDDNLADDDDDAPF